ncbi:MAG: hypothetical protein EPO40_05705 [Myxococcaceae bacterium]|nr:MAG: hypothetical protein EPO40_05705 [Myxococcaceae bacterium]
MSQAKRHARGRVDGKDRFITNTLGLPPADVARESYEYRTAIRQVADTGRLEELREDLRRGEDVQALVGTPWRYTVGLVVVWGLEVAGSFLILRALGVPAEHRPLPALALTLAMIGLTKVTVAATSTPSQPAVPVPPDDDPEPGAPGAAASKGSDPVARRPLSALATIPLRRYLLPLVFGGLVAAVAFARVMGSDAADVPPLVAWSEAVIMIAIACGPSFAAVWLEGKRAPALELARQVALVRGRLRAEQRRVEAAEQFLTRLDRAQGRWTRANAELRAGYGTAYELALATERPDAGDGPRGAGALTPSNGR